MWAEGPRQQGRKHQRGGSSPCPRCSSSLGVGRGIKGSKERPGWAPPHTRCPPLPRSFLWRQWKHLHVGDLVCLHRDNVVPVSRCERV